MRRRRELIDVMVAGVRERTPGEGDVSGELTMEIHGERCELDSHRGELETGRPSTRAGSKLEAAAPKCRRLCERL
jgi:hypothetical protein